MKRLSVLSLILVFALLATAGTALASQSKTAYRAGLSGPNSDAHGNAVVVLSDDGSRLSYKLVVNGLDDTIMAHIHVADAPGGNGPVVLWLYPAQPPASLIPGVFNGLLGSGSATSADLTGAAGITTLDQLRTAIEEGRAYVNVHTVANPGGEIRGDLH